MRCARSLCVGGMEVVGSGTRLLPSGQNKRCMSWVPDSMANTIFKPGFHDGSIRVLPAAGVHWIMTSSTMPANPYVVITL